MKKVKISTNSFGSYAYEITRRAARSTQNSRKEKKSFPRHKSSAKKVCLSEASVDTLVQGLCPDIQAVHKGGRLYIPYPPERSLSHPRGSVGSKFR